MKDLSRIADLSADDPRRLLHAGDTVRDNPCWNRSLLQGDTVVLYFAKPSTRTRLSFASAVTRLGGVPQVVGPAELQLGRGETIPTPTCTPTRSTCSTPRPRAWSATCSSRSSAATSRPTGSPPC